MGAQNTGQDIAGPGVVDADIDAPEAWDIETGSANVIIAVIDSGTQWDHPDLAANMWTNADEIPGNGIDDDGNGFVDDVRGWNFYSNDNDPNDESGHGTHVASTVAAVADNGIGVAGICWNCRVMPLRFIGPFGGSTADAIDAIDYAVANGAQISNNSWGGGPFSSVLRDTIAAAGNDGRNSDSSPAYPGAYDVPTILNVANTTNTDGLSGTSNYGAVSVDIGAPGTNIASTYSSSGYQYNSGTSMASPHAAGVAGLVLSANPGFSPAQIKAAIMNNTRPVASLSGLTVTGGALNAFAALTGEAPEPPPAPPAAPSGLAAADGADGTALLSWSDNSADEDGFEIQQERRIRKNRWGETASGTVGADATGAVATLTADTYRFRVRSFNSGGSSACTAWAEVTVTDGSGGGDNGGGGGGRGGGKKKYAVD